VNSPNSARLAACSVAMLVLIGQTLPALSQTVGLPPASTFTGTLHRAPDGTIVVEPPSVTPPSSAPSGRKGASKGGARPSATPPVAAVPSPGENGLSNDAAHPNAAASSVPQAQFTQLGPKLVGTGAAGPVSAEQGYSVSLSGDGNTAVVGGPFDSDGAGAAWVYTRSGGVWSQQGPKLVGTGALGYALQGYSVSLSGDGNTAIVGGVADNGNAGATWVYTRSGGVWSQQAKLVGTGAVIPPQASQGHSVSLSDDGNTAVVGGPNDNNNAGAAWVFTRSGGVWSQQAKLVGAGTEGPISVSQGASVSLSGDGNTAVVGGPGDNDETGAAWVFTRSGGVWTQQGSKLVGADVVGPGAAEQGYSVSLSGDGNTAIVGGIGDHTLGGAAWVFTRSGGVWNQQAKLVGADVVAPGFAEQGYSVSLSGDGNTAIVGGPFDSNSAGAAWVFTRSGGVWTQRGPKLVGSGAIIFGALGDSVALSGDARTAIVGSQIDAAWTFVQPVFPGTPGKANCHGQSVSALARQYGGLNNAATALGYASVRALQDAILAFCGG